MCLCVEEVIAKGPLQKEGSIRMPVSSQWWKGVRVEEADTSTAGKASSLAVAPDTKLSFDQDADDEEVYATFSNHACRLRVTLWPARAPSCRRGSCGMALHCVSALPCHSPRVVSRWLAWAEFLQGRTADAPTRVKCVLDSRQASCRDGEGEARRTDCKSRAGPSRLVGSGAGRGSDWDGRMIPQFAIAFRRRANESKESATVKQQSPSSRLSHHRTSSHTKSSPWSWVPLPVGLASAS